MLPVKGYKWTYARRSFTLALHTYRDTWNRTVKWRVRSVAATIRTSNLPLTRRMLQCSSKWAGTYFPVSFRHSGDVSFTLSFDPNCLPLWSCELFLILTHEEVLLIGICSQHPLRVVNGSLIGAILPMRLKKTEGTVSQQVGNDKIPPCIKFVPFTVNSGVSIWATILERNC